MSGVSPTIEGFRAAFRRPSLTFAEIAWRWTVGAVAWALFLFWCIEYLDTLPVTDADAALLWTRQPLLVGRAIAHILRGSLNRAALAALLAALALSLLWIIAASVGRGATVRSLLDYFRRGVACSVSGAGESNTAGQDSASGDSAAIVLAAVGKDVASNDSTETHLSAEPRLLPSLIGINFLRIALTIAGLLAFAGAALLVRLALPRAHPHPGLAFMLFLPLAGLICVVWPMLNWLLSLACIFAVRDGDDVLSAISAAVTFSRERSGPVFAVSTWTGLAHLTALSVATTAVSFPIAFVRVAPTRLIIACAILVMLAYFAVVDWLYMARLGGYVCIAEMPEILAESAASPTPPPRTSIDRDELIVSDVPNLVVET
jgi:hypothetical protein